MNFQVWRMALVFERAHMFFFQVSSEAIPLSVTNNEKIKFWRFFIFVSIQFQSYQVVQIICYLEHGGKTSCSPQYLFGQYDWIGASYGHDVFSTEKLKLSVPLGCFESCRKAYRKFFRVTWKKLLIKMFQFFYMIWPWCKSLHHGTSLVSTLSWILPIKVW